MSEHPGLPQDLLDHFPDRIRVPPVTLGYRIGALLVSVLMVLLPLIYLALIGLLVYGAYWHLTTNIGILAGRPGARGRLLAYFGPAIVALVLLAFLVKPLFAKKGRPPRERTLDPGEQPLLFAFVARLCGAIGAREPKEIRLNMDLNASAGFHEGSSLLGKDKVLRLGLPLVQTTNLQQFTGILAHEFGHFSQGTGMVLGGLIWRINAWFFRVVHEKDSWDEALESWTKVWGWTGVLGWIAKFFVWLTRRILALLARVGVMASAFLSRRMEYDADRYETALVGSRGFADSMFRVSSLSWLWQRTLGLLGHGWSLGILPDNLPALFSEVVEREEDQEFREGVEEFLAQEKGSAFATHPLAMQRILAAEKEERPPVFTAQGPASALLQDYESLAREMTQEHFEEVLGGEVTRGKTMPSNAFYNLLLEEEKKGECYEKLAGSLAEGRRLLRVAPKKPEESSYPRLIRDLGARIANLEDNLGRAEDDLEWSWNRYVQTQVALEMATCHLKFPTKAFSVPSRDRAEIQPLLEERRKAFWEAWEKFEACQEPLEERLNLGLGYLETHPQLLEEEERSILGRVPPLLDALRSLWGDLLDFELKKASLALLLEDPHDLKDKNGYLEALGQAEKHALHALGVLQQKLEGLPSPFSLCGEDVSVLRYLGLPGNMDKGPEGLVAYGEELRSSLEALLFRAHSALAYACLQAEKDATGA
ncbi:MAG TPA: hypothetical protein ENK02_14215 [Planctomycetes bacterium]|nr:hypothetical protein [Planctomycetota bacterium]